MQIDPSTVDSVLVIRGNNLANYPEVNVQLGDRECVFEFEGTIRLKQVTAMVINGDPANARYQFYFEIEDISRLKKEV